MADEPNTSKREYYDRMGWCECNTCGIKFLEWEQYVEHVCAQGVDMRKQVFPWTLTGDQ